MAHHVKFFPNGRGKARCAPDPRFPNGIAITAGNSKGVFCKVDLPYPAPECGQFTIECDQCGLTALITAAGRVDDPVSVEVACRKAGA